jgi:hypothetical protein
MRFTYLQKASLEFGTDTKDNKDPLIFFADVRGSFSERARFRQAAFEARPARKYLDVSSRTIFD